MIYSLDEIFSNFHFSEFCKASHRYFNGVALDKKGGGGMRMLFSAFLLLCATTVQAATLDGQTVGYQYFYPDLSTPIANPSNGNYVVGSGVEIADILEYVGSIDISDTNIFIELTSSPPPGQFIDTFGVATFNGFVISDVLFSLPDFKSVTIDASTSMTGFDSSRVSFDADAIYVNFSGLNIDPTETVSLNVSVVPIPAAVWLLGSALAGLGWMRRKRTV